MENSMEFPQKIKNRTTIWSIHSTSENVSEDNKNTIQRDTCTAVVSALLFTVAKLWKELKCPLIGGWINFAICKNQRVSC